MSLASSKGNLYKFSQFSVNFFAEFFSRTYTAHIVVDEKRHGAGEGEAHSHSYKIGCDGSVFVSE